MRSALVNRRSVCSRWYPCLCVLDAAAGAGSAETKGGQPDGSGRHRPQEEEEVSGFSILFLCGGRTLFQIHISSHISSLQTLPLSPSRSPSSRCLDLAGIGARSVSLQQRRVGLQARAAAHHTRQPQGLALLPGEREIHQPLPFPLQELSQVGFTSEGRRAGQVSGESSRGHCREGVGDRKNKQERVRGTFSKV